MLDFLSPLAAIIILYLCLEFYAHVFKISLKAVKTVAKTVIKGDL